MYVKYFQNVNHRETQNLGVLFYSHPHAHLSEGGGPVRPGDHIHLAIEQLQSFHIGVCDSAVWVVARAEGLLGHEWSWSAYQAKTWRLTLGARSRWWGWCGTGKSHKHRRGGTRGKCRWCVRSLHHPAYYAGSLRVPAMSLLLISFCVTAVVALCTVENIPNKSVLFLLLLLMW